MNETAALVPYMPIDRRHALAQSRDLGDRTTGSALFADVSGFTALTGALMRELGPKRGAEEVLVYLNPVFDSLIGELHLYGGVVISFAGDSITCWLEGDNGGRAVACAMAMQEVMRPYASMTTEAGTPFSLHIKVAIAVGPARRFTVGMPEIQLVDVLAGDTLMRMAAAEGLAEKGEIVVDDSVIARLSDALEIESWRTNSEGFRVAVVADVYKEPVISPWPPLALDELDFAQVCSWLLKPVQERILAGRGFLAELRPAVALFLRFTGINYDRDDNAGKKLTDYIRWVQSVIARTDGYLIQLTVGDKGSFLYVAYGAPIGHDDNAVRAVAAALELRARSTSFDGIDQVQLGISAGRMWTGAYGAAARRTYGVMGNETNMAARLMGKAKPGQILITRQVLDATMHHYRFNSLGEIQVKGREAPLPVWEVIDRRRGAASEWAQFDKAFVGRHESLELMFEALNETLQGKGQVLQLSGDAGIGKSHLAYHFSEEAESKGFRLAVASCQSITRSSTYSPWRQLFRVLLDLEEEDQDSAIAKLTAFIEEEHPEWLVRLPLLGDLLALPIPENPTIAALDAGMRQKSLFSLVVEMIQYWASQTPIFLAIENAHWMDEASASLTEAIAKQMIAGSKVLLLIVQRGLAPDDSPLAQIRDLSHYQLVQLRELPDDDLADLVSGYLKGETEPLLVDILREMTRGNPLFVGELVETLRQSNQIAQEEVGVWRISSDMLAALRAGDLLIRDEGQWLLKPDADLSSVKLGIPDSIHSIVLDRLDRLPEGHKLTLKVGSVIGHEFDLPLVGRAYPEQKDPGDLRQEAEELEDEELLQRKEMAEEIYFFRHHTTQEVAYETLLFTQRQQLHRSVAIAMRDDRHTTPTQIAHHAFLGQEWALSLEYNAVAGERAKDLYANQQGIDFFEKALKSAQKMPEEETAEKSKAIHLALGELLVSTAKYGAADEHLRAALELAQKSGDKEAAARACRWMGRSFELQGDYPSALTWLDEGRDSLAGLDTPEEAEILLIAGLIHSRQGDYEQTMQLCDRSLKVADKLEDDLVRARTYNLLGIVTLRQGDAVGAIERFEESLRLYEGADDLYGQATSHNLLANSHFVLSHWSVSDYHFRKSLQMFTQIGDTYNLVLVNNNAGGIALKQGRLDDGLGYYQRAVRLLEQIGGTAWVFGTLHMNIGSAHIQRSELDDAESELNQARDYYESSEVKDYLPELYGLYAELALKRNDLNRAETLGQKSIDLAKELKLPVEEGHNLRILGEVAFARKDYEKAGERFESANALVAEAGDEYECAKTQLSLAQLHLAMDEVELARLALDNCVEVFDRLDARMDLIKAREFLTTLPSI
ncbi:MAG: tetratricopeptide repeat protein [Candidatus Promineifilaceae bacterium]